MGDGQTLRVHLTSPLPVAILYVTVVPSDTGEVFFYPDIYGHDARLSRALAAVEFQIPHKVAMISPF